jgi:hypothetical protein
MRRVAVGCRKNPWDQGLGDDRAQNRGATDRGMLADDTVDVENEATGDTFVAGL